jgi:hypothetical protein
MSEQLNITFDEARRLAVIMRDQQVPEPIEGHSGLWWIEGILTTQERGLYATVRAPRHIDEDPKAEK